MSEKTDAFDIELPACFYLGREYDLNAKQVQDEQYVMYDARDLTTHGVIVGMTGSGKTGLSISLLEEAAIDGIPSIIIDPKGDLTNLLLQFPDLDPKSFEKWVSEEDARQKNLTKRQYSKQLSELWKKGLTDTAQPLDRVARLKASSDWRIYTPGSSAGLPLSILGSFSAPTTSVPHEILTQKIDAVATALLGLTGLTADPVQSREHILIAQLLLHAWEKREDLDLTGLIMQIQNPPFRRVGAYNMETFFPSKDRLKFASSLNNVLASPSFSTWTMGEPLDLSNMLYRAGKPQQLIFYVAHLDDTQRMFFITLLLEEVLSWTRKQSGSSNLRALLYFDEVYGYLPPHPGNPPSKQPLLTLLKQARAFGVGVLLATQNPVDLDYKALSNAGTWFVGKLQTERDKARLLDGLESVAAEQGSMTDRRYLEKVIASLGSRIFLLHDIHRPKPLLFQSRWALSFLRGPMTRTQVEKLMKPIKDAANNTAPVAIPLCTHCHEELTADAAEKCPNCGENPWAKANFRVADQEFREGLLQQAAPMALPVASVAQAEEIDPSLNTKPPVLPHDVTQFYLPANVEEPAENAILEYRAHILGFAEVVFLINKRSGKEHVETFRRLAIPTPKGHPINWGKAQVLDDQLVFKAQDRACWDQVPDTLDTGRKLKGVEKSFVDHIYSSEKLALWENRKLSMVSEPGESKEAFLERCKAVAEEEARQALDLERAKFRPKFEALGLDMPEEAQESSGFFSWILGGSRSSGPPSSRQEEKERKLESDYEAKKAEIGKKWERSGKEIKAIQIKPRKMDIRLTHFGIGWLPVWRFKKSRSNKKEVIAYEPQL